MNKTVRQKLFSILPLVIFFLICLFVGTLAGKIILSKEGADLGLAELLLHLLEMFVILVLVVLLQIMMHETGHMLAALMRGWTFSSFMFLNVMLTRYDGKFRISRYSIPGAGGQCLMIPPEKGDTNWGIILYNAGGIIMNAFLGVVSLIILYVFYDHFNFESASFFMLSAVVGILFALTNGIPLLSGGIANDGMNMLKLRKDKFSTEVFLTSMRVAGTLQKGGMIGDVLDSYMCDGRHMDLSNPIHVMALNLDLSFAMSVMDFDKASSIIRRAMNDGHKITGIYRDEFNKERVFLALIRPDGTTDVGRLLDARLRDYISKMSLFRPDALRVGYAVALLYEHDAERASRLYDKFGTSCARYHSRGDVRSEMMLIEEVRRVAAVHGRI